MKTLLPAALAGAFAAAVLGLLTFGAQATVAPDHVPLAIAAPDGPARAAAQRIASQGGEHVAWRVTSLAEGRSLLADKEVYGVIELTQPPVVVLSGAINPSGTQTAQQVLTGVAQALPGGPAKVETLHPASTAGRVGPLAASALLWIAGLVAGLLFTVLSQREGSRTGPGRRLVLAVAASVLSVGVVAGLLLLWDSGLDLGWDVLGFLLLAAFAFTTVQGALLRLIGIRAAAIMTPLYLIAPAVAGQVPELLHPVYRALLWSWTPFRFSTEGTRSLLQGLTSAPDVRTGVIVLSSLAVAGLIIILLPGKGSRARSVTEMVTLR